MADENASGGVSSHRAMASWAGAVASGICALHCIALPAVSAALLLAGVSLPAQGYLELALIAGSLLLGGIALFPPVLRGGDPLYFQLAVLAAGFFLVAWQGTMLSAILRQSLSVSSSALLLLAHAGNLWRMRTARPPGETELRRPDCTA